jgi:two-component system LytT family response regulator
MMIRTIIVDDEPLAREGIRLRLTSEPDISIVGEYGSAKAAAAAIAHDAPDLLFLDIQMPHISGLGLLRQVGPERVPAVILVTAHGEHALEAYEVSVVDYVLKPIDDERFRVALDRARRRLREVQAVRVGARLRELVGQLESPAGAGGQGLGATGAGGRAFLTRFIVTSARREVPVPVGAVDWIEAAGDYVRLHCGDKSLLVRGRMSDLESTLDPRQFGRIHRGAIVRFDRVRELRPTGHGEYELFMTTGAVLQLSRTYRDTFMGGLRTAPVQRGPQSSHGR